MTAPPPLPHASMPSVFPSRALTRPRTDAAIFAAIAGLAVALRVAAGIVLGHRLESDALSYFTMAQNLAEHGVLIDNFGLHAFYSAGYPLLLAPFFLIFGNSITVAIAVNLALTVATLLLIRAIARLLSTNIVVARIATLGFALWLPAIWNATMLAKENLSTPLLLGLLLCALHVARGERPVTKALIGGLLWGASLLTGASTLLLCAAMAVALILLWRAHDPRLAIRSGLCFSLGALILLAPWLHATDRMLGTPVLTTNAAFNLYLGNNPAATGRFVSISDTPEGDGWNARHRALGEMGTARRLQDKAQQWIAANPAKAAALAMRKLIYFWEPNIPDAADFAASRAVASIRAVDVAQYGAILLLGLWGLYRAPLRSCDRAIMIATIAGFWAIHALAYIIIRYRDPIMPLMMLFAAFPAAALWDKLTRRSARNAA